MASVAKGEQVTILAEEDGWYEIEGLARAGGTARGWVSADHVDLEQPAPTEDVRERVELSAGDLVAGVEVETNVRTLLVVPLTPRSAFPVPAATFALGSSFPGPSVFVTLRRIMELAATNVQFRLFGHTDELGSDADNKTLSDRRAQGVLAMLTRDVELFEQVAAAETWGVAESQAMLRALGCNPGMIDGHNGPLTREACWNFQDQWNLGFHLDELPPPLAVDGLLGPKTDRALREAYVRDTPGSLPVERLSGPGFSGCSEFNPTSSADAENRRVMVVPFRAYDTPADAFPCRAGDAGACLLDGEAPIRCSFYRDTVKESDEEIGPWFYDFEWLLEEDGQVYLSCLTSIPDGSQVTFTVHHPSRPLEFPPPAPREVTDPMPELGEEVASLSGAIKGGVAWVRWSPPDDRDPFNLICWAGQVERPVITTEAEARAWHRALKLEAQPRPPVFSVRAGGRWGVSPAPGTPLTNVYGIDEAPEGSLGLGLASNGALVHFDLHSGRHRERQEHIRGLVALKLPLTPGS